MDDLRCPVCDVSLLETRSTRAVLWTCPSCTGKCVGHSLLRRTADRRWADELWATSMDGGTRGDRACPSCRAAMFETSGRGVVVDLCRGCHLVWFDKGEYDRAPIIPERGARTLPQEALETMARGQATVIAADYKTRYGRDMTVAEALPLVPGLTGLPLEEEQRALSRWPWVTWACAVLLTGLGAWALLRPDDAEALGLIATDIDRLGGATLVTALLVHPTLFQLVTNVYFLAVFGDNVEDFLGPATFGLLLVTGGLAGNALHALFDANDPVVMMGASGSISAATLFYALRFPDARLRYIRLARWHVMPASAGLLFWLLTKLASTQTLFGRAEPSVWPYVGGTVVGLVFWFLLRDSVVTPVRNGS